MFGRLLPKETSFYDFFEQHAALTVDGTREFSQLVQSGQNIDAKARRIKEIEHETDVITHRCVEALHRSFITPMDRDDIHRLITRMDDIMDFVEAASERVALYAYAHLPQRFKAQRQIHAEDLPTPAVKLALLGLAIGELTRAGYRYIGMDHFALPDDPLARAQDAGTLRRNFQGYSSHGYCDLIGLGLSAISRVDGCYAQNARELPSYYERLVRSELPIVRDAMQWYRGKLGFLSPVLIAKDV